MDGTMSRVRLETKTVQAQVTEAKADGTATALVSVFGNVDLGGDRVMPGAFTRTLTEWQAKGDPIPVIWSHDWDNPESFVGWADPATIKESDQGLVVPMQFDLDRPRAEQVHHLLKTRRVTQFSFGYFVREYDTVNDEQYGAVRELKDIDLFEVGPTLLGMNPETELLAAASALRARKAAPETHAVDVPAYVAGNADRGLAYYEQGLGGDGLVEQTIRDARDMAAGTVRDAKVRLMGPWIARHIDDLDAPQNSNPDDDGYPGPGLVAMLLWGAGPDKEGARRTQAWAEAEAARLDDADSASKATADEAVEGAFATWMYGDEQMTGRIEHVMTEGVLGAADSPNAIEATPEDPALLLRIFDDGQETDTFMSARASQVTIVDGPGGDDSEDIDTAPAFASTDTDTPAQDAGDIQGTIPSEHITALLTRPRYTEE